MEIMDINIWMIPLAIIAVVLVIKLCTSIITKVITAVISFYVVFGESMNVPSIKDIFEMVCDLLNINI